MRRFLLIFIIMLSGLGLILVHCAPLKLVKRGGGISGGVNGDGNNERDNRNNNNDDDDDDDYDDDDDDDYDYDDDDESGGRFCDDYPNDRACVCERDPDDSRCEDDEETSSEAHKRLRNRYETWVNLDDISTSTVEEFLSGATISHGLRRVRAYFDLNKQATQHEHSYKGKIQILVEAENPSGGTSFREGLPFSAGSGDDVKYNVWSRDFRDHKNKLGFHGFFEDMKHGSIILVVDDVSVREGEREEILGRGSIWFMRFKSSDGKNHKDCYQGGRYIGLGGSGLPTHPSKRCWFVSGTPFDCRAWKGKKTRVDTYQAIEPTDSCYQKLGSFGESDGDTLDVKEAFNLSGDESFLN